MILKVKSSFDDETSVFVINNCTSLTEVLLKLKTEKLFSKSV